MGIWKKRASPLRYSMAGIAVGGVVSYAFWRWQFQVFHGVVNNIFEGIVKQRYMRKKQLNSNPGPQE